MKSKHWISLGALCALPTALPAFAPGDAAYTKRVETALLAEPQMLATPVARIGYAKKLKIEALKGPWVRVSEGKNSGWVFAGNLAEETPSETRGLDGLPFAASETSAAAAARPLIPDSEEYAARHDLGKAVEDLTWLTQQKAATPPAEIRTFLQAQKKGEFQ